MKGLAPSKNGAVAEISSNFKSLDIVLPVPQNDSQKGHDILSRSRLHPEESFFVVFLTVDLSSSKLEPI